MQLLNFYLCNLICPFSNGELSSFFNVLYQLEMFVYPLGFVFNNGASEAICDLCLLLVSLKVLFGTVGKSVVCMLGRC